MAAASRTAAEALKRQCHHVITAMGPQTPPEVFVYRGNAYKALQQPFLALADYNIANRVIRLSGKHQEECMTSLKQLPSQLTATYPATDNHLHMLVNPVLGNGVELKRIDDAMGRGVFATRAIESGEVVLRSSDPWIQYPLVEGACSFCAKKLPARVFACTNEKCHEEYCSRECRSQALVVYHGKVCTNEGFQGVELDLFSQMLSTSATPSQRNITAGYLLTMRVVAAAMLQRSVPTALPEVRSLTGRLVFDPSEVAGPMLELYDKLARFCGCSTSIFFEEFIGVYARIRSNSFQHDRSLAWHVPRSMLNHSCDPNVVLDSSSGVLKTICRVKPGDELTLSYYPFLNPLPSEARRIELLKRDFVCSCPKCLAGY